MRQVKLSGGEKKIENALLKGEYANIGKAEQDEIARALSRRKKDAVLNIRMNGQDLDSLKQKARKLGVKYQTFISEFLHRLAHS